MSHIRFTPPAKLANQFKEMHQPEYNEDDLAWLLGEYEDNGNPTHTRIRELLFALRDFLDATTLQPAFKNMRDSLKDKDKLLPILEKIGKALQKAKAMSINKESDLGTREIFGSAAEFISKSIAIRLRELEDANDAVFGIYAHKDNTLKTEIPPVTLRALAQRQKL